MSEFEKRLKMARESSWHHFGKKIIFYLPGMFVLNGVNGKYPATSITGKDCALKCDHCQGKILDSMLQATTPEKLVAQCLELAATGNHGVLISGGCDLSGRLPWDRFIPAIEEIKRRTDLFISIHSGLINEHEAFDLKQAGVDQALIDVVGDDDTFRKMYHVPFGVKCIHDAMVALQEAGLSMIPHIVCGLNYGHIKGEKQAVEMIAGFKVEQLVVVSLMAIPGTPVWGTPSPTPEAVADVIAEARTKMPATPISLGCARQRGNHHLETLAIDAGVNCMALPSDEAVAQAKSYDLEIHYQKTCCSVTRDISEPGWWLTSPL
ncbi:MAG: radical SAM protein [Deltaproteobacteria bacterium]|nr:radical SAM protein [Deltaproteobacteria bacterium]